MVTVEVCVEGVAGVRHARAGGARRAELCSALAEGGLTPGPGTLRAALALEGIEVIVLARPRGGDFLYGEDELAALGGDVESARALGAPGVALGCLTGSGDVDRAACARLVELAGPMAVTFHRAFDHLRAPLEGLELLVELGFRRVLTSGQAPSASEGAERLAELVTAARGRIEVVAAGGVRPANVAALVARTGVSAVHASAGVRLESAMLHRNPRPRLSAARAPEEYAHWETDAGAVRALVSALGDRPRES